MDRDSFIKVLNNCIWSAVHTEYPNIDLSKLSDRGLIEFAELVRDLLQLRLDKLEKHVLPVAPADGKFH